MNSKNSLLRLGIAAIMLCLLAATFITGCGGANSSGGDSSTPTQPSSSGTLPSSYNLRGKLISDSKTLSPVASVTIKLLMQDPTTSNFKDTGKSTISLSSGEFSFLGISKGVYVLSTNATATFQESQKLIVINESNTTSDIETGNMLVMPIGSTPTGEVTLKGKTIADGPGATPIGGLTIRLSRLGSDGAWSLISDKVAQSLSSGEFVFLKLETGTYKIDIDGMIGGIAKYTPSSKLAIIGSTENLTSIDVGNIIMVTVPSPSTAIPTINLKARLFDTLASAPMSIAIVSADSGQTTVSDGFGFFELKNLEAGVRRISVTKNGMASFSLSFEVLSNAGVATGISLNNQTYAINSADNRTVDLFKHGLDIKITLQQHHSGSLMGTVKEFVIQNNQATYITTPRSNYSFELWQKFPDGSFGRHGSVTSDEDGEWKVDNLPPYEDNGSLWYALAAGTIVQVNQTTKEIIFVNSSSEWSGRTPVLAASYKVQAGETTIMDFTLPPFLSNPYQSNVVAVADAKLATDSAAIFPGGYSFDLETKTLENVYFKWTGPQLVKKVTISFQRAYKKATTPTIQQIYDSVAGTVNTQTFKPTTIGLDFGRYTWKTTVYDSNAPTIPIDSPLNLFTVYPSSTDITPSNNSIIEIKNATYTVTFIAPKDDEATSVSMELYRVNAGSNILVANPKVGDISITPIWSIEFPPNEPNTPDAFKWRAVYYYLDGPPLYSEFANLTFQ